MHLVNDILDIQKLDSGKLPIMLQPVEMAAIVREALATNLPYAKRLGVHLELGAALEGMRVLADPVRLAQVLANLLSNAIKLSPPTGCMTISVQHSDARARVSVTDRGLGIPEAFRPRLFQKFAQADTSGAKAGTGLGLSIAKAIIERHGGRIGFDSREGQGTTFWFVLPLL